MKYRKIIAFIVAVCLLSILSVSASAAETAGTGGGMYDISKGLEPLTEQGNPAVPVQAEIAGKTVAFYPEADHFVLSPAVKPDCEYALFVLKESAGNAAPGSDLPSITEENLYFADQKSSDASGTLTNFVIYPRTLTEGSYSIWLNSTAGAERLGHFSYAVGIGGEAEKPQFVTGASMNVGNSLKMNFFIEKAVLNGRTDVTAQVTKTYADGRADAVKNIPYTEWKTRGTMVYFDFSGISAKEMTDIVSVQILDHSGHPLSAVYQDSVHDYALRMLKKQNPDALKTLLVDMLNYGAASQRHFGYSQQHLADADIQDYQHYATGPVAAADHRVKGENYYGTSLMTKSNISMNFFFQNVNADMHAEIIFQSHHPHDKKISVPGSDFKPRSINGKQLMAITVDELVSADIRQMVTCNIYNSSNELVATITDSMESYIARMSNTDPVFESIMKFGSSAYLYFHKQ